MCKCHLLTCVRFSSAVACDLISEFLVPENKKIYIISNIGMTDFENPEGFNVQQPPLGGNVASSK